MANDTGLAFLRDAPPSGGEPVFAFDNTTGMTTASYDD